MSYIFAENAAFEARLATRSARTCADFLLPHLSAGMAVLDCGCGPGSITLDLARHVAPGRVVGVDRARRAVESARVAARAQRVKNVSFRVARAERLPFEGGAFDAAFAHMVLFHVSDPAAVIAELRRVVRPGGLIALRDRDFGGTLLSPVTPPLTRAMELSGRWLELAGASPFYARSQRAMLLAAGCSEATSYVAAVGGGSLGVTRGFAALEVTRLRGAAFRRLVAARGLATPEEIEALCGELTAWGERPDAFCSVTVCSALGRV